MEQNYSHLEWDSNFFGFNVARINRVDIDGTGLISTLQELKSKNYRMVYWYVPVEQAETLRFAQAHGGFLADQKVTYIKELTNTVLAQGSSLYFTVPYIDAEPDAALIRLALQSGGHSRFRLDPLFPDVLCDKLYTCWITRSVRKEIAWQLLVARDANELMGLITLGTKEKRGDIGLMAVASNARGRGIGQLLMVDAERCFMERGYAIAQVVTQRANSEACRLYESCGYRIERINNVFHFWLLDK